jgi:anti-sigma-K factor RskA
MSRVKRYQDPEVYERLAAEYVLGTMKGRALARFERLLYERPYIRYAVEMWEEKLNPMIETIPEVAPPKRVWQAIQKEIRPGEAAGVGARHDAQGFLASLGLFRSAAFWQATTAMLAVALGLKTLLPLTENPAPMPALSYVSVLEGEGDKPMVVTMGDKKRRIVSVRLMETPKMEEERVLELWAIKDPDSKPVRVGVVPAHAKQSYLKLSKQEWQRMKGAKQFAITFEPKGRKQFDEPSGPIMYKGKCIDFI